MDPKTYYTYKVKMRQVLETKVGYTEEQLNNKKRAFEKVKA